MFCDRATKSVRKVGLPPRARDTHATLKRLPTLFCRNILSYLDKAVLTQVSSLSNTQTRGIAAQPLAQL
jgi:hypothetical protein